MDNAQHVFLFFALYDVDYLKGARNVLEMKNSGIEWIGEIPINWHVRRNKYNFTLNKTLVGNVYSATQLLSLTKNGIKAITEEDQKGKIPASFSTYQTVNKDDIVMCLFDLDVSAVFSGVSPYEGMISPAYKCFKCKEHLCSQYIDYYFRTVFVDRKYKRYSKNVRYSIGADEFMSLPILVPPLEVQKSIANFLDQKCSEIDTLSADIQSQIDVLEEYKRSVITEVVTKGLNPDVEMKDSGIEWIGIIPAHWFLSRLKYNLSTPMKYGASEAGVDYSEGLPRYIRITDITSDGKLKEDGKLSLTLAQASNYLLTDDTVLFARSGGTVGKTFLYTKECGLSAFAGYLISGVTNKAKMLPKWLWYFSLSNSYWEWANQIFTQATIQNIGADKYSNLPITAPNIHEQKELVMYLDTKCAEIDAIIVDKKAQLETLAEYKKSLIYEYVTGKKEIAL